MNQKIALFPLENVKYTSFLQIAKYHRLQGDLISWYSALQHYEYDKVYCASLFDFTDKSMVRPDMICGGTGFDIETKLPPEIESCGYDYSIYPKCIVSFLWFSRGCIRNNKTCPWCVVPKKEGLIRPVEPKNANPHEKEIHIMDNNPFANPEKDRMVEYVLKQNKPVTFTSGIDCRLPVEDYGSDLKRMKIKRLHTAWDNPKDELTENLKALTKYVPAWKIGVYVLIGAGSTREEDWYRVTEIEKIGMDPWVMPYDLTDPYQKRFRNLVNRVPRFKQALKEGTSTPSYLKGV